MACQPRASLCMGNYQLPLPVRRPAAATGIMAPCRSQPIAVAMLGSKYRRQSSSRLPLSHCTVSSVQSAASISLFPILALLLRFRRTILLRHLVLFFGSDFSILFDDLGADLASRALCISARVIQPAVRGMECLYERILTFTVSFSLF